MSKPAPTSLEKPPLGIRGTPVKLTGREESMRLVAEMTPRRTPQTAKSCRKLGEGPSRWPGQEKSWTTPRRRVEKDSFSENMQTSGKTKLKPVSLFTPPRHYREELWPTSAALSPINVNGGLSKEERQGGAKHAVHDIAPAEKVLSSRGDLVPSLSASGRRVQFGSRSTHLKGKELFEADRDSSQVYGQKRVVWSNPTFCAEGLLDKTSGNSRPADYHGEVDNCTGKAENSNGVTNEQVFHPSNKLQQLTYNAESSNSFLVGENHTTISAADLQLVLGSNTDKTSVLFGDGLSERNESPQKDTAVAMVEADLEAEIRRNIEEEIENEIRILSEKLAELHARQGVRQTDRDQCPDVALSCPQTPILSARWDHTPDRIHFVQDFISDAKESPAQDFKMHDPATRIIEEDFQAAEGNTCKHRKNRTVSAKFLSWNKNVGTCGAKSEEKKPMPKRGVISGRLGSSPQVPRRGMSLGGATLISKRREASAHTPHPRPSSRPADQKGPPDVETQSTPSNFQWQGPPECKANVENAGSKALGVSSDQAPATELGKAQKLIDHSVEESSTKPQTQSPVLSAWHSLGMSKRFDWIKTLRSAGEDQCVKQQGFSSAFKGDDQEQNNLSAAEVKPRPSAGKASPVLPDKSDSQAPKSAGSRMVASRYGSSPLLGGGLAPDKGIEVGWNPDRKLRREDRSKTPGSRSGPPTHSVTSPAKPLKNENTKAPAAVVGDASRVAPRLTPKSISVRTCGQNSSLLQGRVSSSRPPFSTGKKASGTLTQKTKGQNIEKYNGGHMAGGPVSRQENVSKHAKEDIVVDESRNEDSGFNSPAPTCVLLTRFEQLGIKKLNVGSSTVKAGFKAETSGTLREQLDGPSASSSAAVLFSYREPSAGTQGGDALKTPSTCRQQLGGSAVHAASPDHFMTPSDLRTPPDDTSELLHEEFWTPSVLFSPPAPGPCTTRDLRPVVIELRSQLKSSPVLKKYSELLKDLDSLEVERNQLPKIATRSFIGISPRDSGCVKRANESSKGHPFGLHSDPSELSHLDAKDLEQSLETLAARFSATNLSGDTGRAGVQGLLVGCLETYAQEGRWENGALMQQVKQDFLATYVKGNAARNSADLKHHEDVPQVSELENLWLLVEKLDKERRDSVYDMLSRQLAKIQQEQA